MAYAVHARTCGAVDQEGRNLRLDIRWGSGSVDRIQMLAKELVDLQPDVILSQSTPVTTAFKRETQSIPVVFVIVADPVGSGFVVSLAHPGGNVTGFINVEAAMGSKWLELLTEMAPDISRAAIMFNPDTAAGRGSYFMPSIEAAARSLKVVPVATPVHDDIEIEGAIGSLAGEPKAGLVVMTDGFMQVHRASIILHAARNRIPAIYAEAISVRDGGLLSYGADYGDMFHRAAAYVDRILRGSKPSELSVQLPVKFELALNAKTAKALGLDVPPALLARADEVIE